jgi:signal transduction histidine kinase
LAIVAEIVAKYDGEVRVESDRLLGGARFTVRLPSAHQTDPLPTPDAELQLKDVAG